MTTLILGGTGFIGRRAVPRLAARGERVAVMDINPNAANFDEFGDLVTVMRGDIMDFEDVVKAILASKPDRIMNLAYLLGSGDDTPHFTMKLNVLGMDNCFEAARVCGVNRVTYASSVAVSGQQSAFGDRMVNEDDAMHGTSQYAMHKRFNEFQAQQFNSVYGMNITGIRPANVTGPDKVRGSTDHVQCVVLPASGEPVSFPKSGFMRLPVHVDDVAEAFVRVTMSRLLRPPGLQHRRHSRQHGRPGRHRAGLPARRRHILRRRRRQGGLRQLPGGQQPSAGRVRAGIPVAGDLGAQYHQRRPPRQRRAAGFNWTQRRKDAKV